MSDLEILADLEVDDPGAVDDITEDAPLALTLESVVDVFEGSRSEAPSRATFRPRQVLPGQGVNDAGDDAGPGFDLAPAPMASAGRLELGTVRPMISVDASLVKVGYTDEGVVAAVRAVAFEQRNGSRRIHMFRPGLAYIGNSNAVEVLHKIGCAFDDPSHYVRLSNGQPVAEKGMGHSHQQRADRLRNFTERMAQAYAAMQMDNGIVVLDGAATPDTYDTPPALIERLARLITSRGNHLVALSKKTSVTVEGRELRHALDGHPEGPYYRYLNEILREERIKAAQEGRTVARRAPLGHIYAVRFSYIGPTYRVDIVPASGYGPDEALASFYASTLFRAGYPEALVRAHLHAYVPYPDLLGFQAAAVAQLGFELRRDLDLTAAFAPFGGRWK